MDAWIAATALAYTPAVFTQDAGFDDLAGVQVIRA
jgi:predicted nucleic acid-binding protein